MAKHGKATSETAIVNIKVKATATIFVPIFNYYNLLRLFRS